MHLVTFASPSHRDMAQRFVVDRAKLAGFSSVIFRTSDTQHCETGVFNDPGFAAATHEKLDALAGLPLWDKYLYVDADCVLFEGLHDYANELRIERGMIGCGFDKVEYGLGILAFVQDPEMRAWFKFLRTLAAMMNGNDQATLRMLCEVEAKLPIPHQFLDPAYISNWSGIYTGVPWQGEEFSVPETSVLWHANFCKGVEMKTKMLEEALMQRENCLTK